jgi:hypothetical protein
MTAQERIARAARLEAAANAREIADARFACLPHASAHVAAVLVEDREVPPGSGAS